MRGFGIIWLVMGWVLAGPAVAQAPLKFEHLTVKDGLSQNAILSMIQDRKGYLWFGTSDGLNKYDGYTFTAYKYTPHDPTSISQNVINKIWEDKQGLIWIGTAAGGICKFDPSTEQFTSYHPPQPKNLFVPALRSASAINEDGEGLMWVGSFGGELRRFNKKTGQFSEKYALNYQSTADESNAGFDRISALYKDRTGTLWVGNRAGMHKLILTPGIAGKPTQVRFQQYRHDPENPNSLSANNVRFIYQDKKRLFWIGTANHGLNRFDPKTGAVTQYQYDPKNPNSLSNNSFFSQSAVEDAQGNLWIGTTNGLNQLNREQTGFTRYRHDPADATSLGSNFVSNLLLDQAGSLWVGTIKGISRTDPHQPPFRSYGYSLPPANALRGSAVSALYEDKFGILWIGTENGLDAFDPQTNQFTHVELTKPPFSSRITSILEDRSAIFWMSSDDKLMRFNRKTGEFNSSSGSLTLDKKLAGHRIYTLYEDRQGLLWIGSQVGVRSFDRQTGTIREYLHDPNNPKTISDHQINAIQEDNRGNIWFGHGSVALSKLNQKTGRFTRYQHRVDDSTSLSSNLVNCIHQDSKGVLWFGTKAGGLCRFNEQSQTFTTFTDKQGLINNTINAILEDNQGNLWLNTNGGLSRFSPTTRTFTNYDVQDGLQSNLLSRAAWKGRDGTLYVGSDNGFNVFNPEDIRPNGYVPPVVITRFRLFDKALPGKSEAAEIELSYHQNFISFEYAALNYTNPQKNQYRYQLEGVDPNWVQAGTRRVANYTNLGPGEYTFRVKGSNNDGLWNEQGTSMRVIIHPPWWRTWWAYAFYTLLFITGLLLARRAIVNRERLRANLRVQQTETESLRELDGMKSRFFANLSHEFRTPLALISGIVQERTDKLPISDGQRADYGLISRHATRLLQLINQLLDLSKLEASQLQAHPEPGDLTALLRALAGSFESLAQSKGLTYRYALPLQSVWAEFDADKVEKIVANLLSNAIKFTAKNGQIVFTADRPEASIRFVVEDTGIGIAPEDLPHIFNRFYQADPTATRNYEGVGIGLALTKELVDLLGGTIAVESRLAEGSSFTVTLPLAVVSPPERISEPILNGHDVKQTAPRSSEPTTAKSGKSHLMKLLVVEDNTDLRQFIQQFLSKNYTVLEAVDGLEGLNQAVDTIPDLIISDVMMPGLDGLTLCQRLKTDERTSHIPLILLTAKADVASKLTGLGYGADDYLTKPFQVDELLARIQNLIAQRQQLRERFSRQLTLKPSDVTVTSADERFLQRALSIVETQLSNPEFDVDRFSREIGMGRTQLYRKLTALTNQSPTDFIRLMRLHRAADLLRQQQGNVSEIALQVGFNSLNYFTRCFREQFGQTPSEYAKAPERRAERVG
ncbi:MAG: response regulator [Cytophagaceae bacterium]|nr:response regulator [Cytophagaceae bacterium]